LIFAAAYAVVRCLTVWHVGVFCRKE